MVTDLVNISPRLLRAKTIRQILILWFFYIFITAVLMAKRPRGHSKVFDDKFDEKEFYSDEKGPDRGILIDNPLEAGLARLKIIDDATVSLNIAYFSIEQGKASNLFFGALVDAADRGVEVNLILDGLFHGLNSRLKSMIYVFSSHPNMNLKFYEPFNPFMPWTFNNRMHDKYLIKDDELLIVGGRNIGDRFFAPKWHEEKITNDRDVIIINSKPDKGLSVVNEIKAYFYKVWGQKFSKPVKIKLSARQHKKALKKREEIKKKFHLAKKEYSALFNNSLDLMELSFPTNKVSFIHNPIKRFSKEPRCWHKITNLMRSADRSIFIQSPYIIPNKYMLDGFIEKEDLADLDIRILTNSQGSTPNLIAHAGYLNHKKKLVDNNIKVYEFQSRDSLHTKSFVIDNDLLGIGSFNLDPRSTYLSTESMVFIHSQEAVDKITKGLSQYLETSLKIADNYDYVPNEGTEVAPSSLPKRFAISTLRYVVKWFEHLL